MNPDEMKSRLSRISTVWTQIFESQQSQGDTRSEAQKDLLERYQPAIYSYLVGALHDLDAADELFQEFALRFIRGDFRHVDPHRGRFRDYLRTILSHMVAKYRKRQMTGQLVYESNIADQVTPEPEDSESDREFINSWRQNLFERAWTALAQVECECEQPYYTVLKFRVDHPHVTSLEMAKRLNVQLRPKQPFTETGFRKMLQRAREWFADLLIDEVGHSMSTCSREQIEQELIDLGLLEYCRAALDRKS